MLKEREKVGWLAVNADEFLGSPMPIPVAGDRVGSPFGWLTGFRALQGRIGRFFDKAAGFLDRCLSGS